MPSRIGLYYPYPRVRNQDWLRIAALYWPKIAKVKPVNWDTQTSPLEEQLQAELDLFVAVSQEQAHHDTEKVIAALLDEHGKELRARYRVRPEAVDAIRGFSEGAVARDGHCFSSAPGARLVTSAWPTPTFGAVHQPPQTELVVIYLRDYTMPLAHHLVEQGLALLDDKERIIAVPPDLAWAYSGLLSDKLAVLNRLVPITDEEALYTSMNEWDTDLAAERLLGRPATAISQPDYGYDTAIGMLAIEQVVPKDLANVPVSKLVQVRRRYGAQLDAFHDLVSEISAEIGSALDDVSDPDVVKAYLKYEVERRLRTPTIELEHAVRGLGIDTALNATAVKVELAGAAIVSIGGPIATDNFVVAAAGAAFAAFSVRHERAKQRSALVRNSPVGYLWKVDRMLRPRPLLQRVLRR